MVHQASKITDPAEKVRYLDWLTDLEFRLYGIPMPEQVFFLDVEPAESAQLIKERLNKFSHEEKKDIHESDREYLEDSYTNALWLVERYGWEHIICMKDGEMRPIEEIHEMLYERLKKYL